MPTGTAVHPADVGYLGSKDGYEATRETSGQDRRETEKGDETRERALSLRGMRGANDEGTRPPNGRARLTRAATKWGNAGGDPPPMARTHGAQPGTEGEPQARQRAPLEQGQGLEEEGGTPSHQRAQTACRQEGWGQTSIRPRASSARSLRAEKGGDPPK